MDDRFNTIAGWTLFGGIVARGLSSLSAHYFHADKTHRPETMGYAIEGVEAEAEGGAAAEQPLPNLLAAGDEQWQQGEQGNQQHFSTQQVQGQRAVAHPLEKAGGKAQGAEHPDEHRQGQHLSLEELLLAEPGGE